MCTQIWTVCEILFWSCKSAQDEWTKTDGEHCNGLLHGTINKWLTTGKLLLILRPTEGRRLSFPDHTVDYEVEELTGVGNRSQINTDDNIVI